MTQDKSKYKVLFVCMGNICRSPAAEGVFRHHVRKAGRSDDILIDSAGTIGYHTGSPPDRRMLEAAARRGYRLESRARQITREDLEVFNLIIAMDHENYGDLLTLAVNRQEHIQLLGSFIVDKRKLVDILPVPDPYYGGTRGFENVLDMIESACPAILDHCLKSVDNA